MADPKAEQNPVTVGFIDTSPTVSQRVPVTAANPLPVTIAAGGADADVNIAAVNGQTATAFNAGVVGTGTQRVVEANVSAATTTSVNSSNVSGTLLAANTARRGVLITNTDANGVYVKYGATASATSFAVLIPSNGYWEMPYPIYTGIIDGIWVADGSGAAIITEM